MSRRLTILALLLWCAAGACAADIAVDRTDPDGVRHVSTSPEVFYDNYFGSATMALELALHPDGTADCLMAVTFDEGDLRFAAGDALEMRLRGGSRVTLHAVSGTQRKDVWRVPHGDRVDELVTVRYRVVLEQLAQLLEGTVTSVGVTARESSFNRKVSASFSTLLGDQLRLLAPWLRP